MKLFKELEDNIRSAYEGNVTVDVAERLAGKFLLGQMQVSEQLKKEDLNSRMRKTGLKSMRAASYLEGVASNDKKPSDVMLNAMVDSDALVIKEQKGLDEAESERDELERLYNIFREAHIYFRGIAKGNFS